MSNKCPRARLYNVVTVTMKTSHVLQYVSTTFGLELKWDGAGRLDISLPNHQARHICGLCGGFHMEHPMVLGPTEDCLPQDPTVGSLGNLVSAIQ